MTLAGKIGDTRWLLIQQAGQGTPKAFVALLVFWLTLLFASFGRFAPRNLTSAVTLTLCAVAVAGAIGMILELERGFGGRAAFPLRLPRVSGLSRSMRLMRVARAG